jgi:flagellar M-ring protein FliF
VTAALGAFLARLRTAPPRSRAIAAAAVLALVGSVVCGFIASRDTRVALFATPLRAEQLAEVEQRLAAWNVPHLATSDNVLVDRAKRSDLLLRLSLAGVPHAHLAGSDEALSRVGALTPQVVLEAQTRDALAADLALGLRGLEGIADARIVIAPSSGGVYADEPQRDASASVRITTAPGTHLGARTVAGIKAFVAGGVPGLDAERVTVLDDRGLALDTDAGDDASDVQTALQSALDAAFGAGSTIVRVHRELLGEHRDVHDIHRGALGGSLARTSSDERYAFGTKKYSKTSATDDHGSDTHDERRVAAPGATARLTVAVFVDAARGLDVAKIRALTAAAAGIRAERGDAVSVEAVAFAEPGTAARVARVPAWTLAFAGILPQALTVVALIGVAAFTGRPLIAVATRAVDAASLRGVVRDVATIAPERVRAKLDGEPPHVAAAVIAALPAATAAAVLELYEPDERAGIVRRLARANPSLLPRPEELIGG